ncbi:hypothetical protein ACHAWF_004875 [Thalassiosira exigua]
MPTKAIKYHGDAEEEPQGNPSSVTVSISVSAKEEVVDQAQKTAATALSAPPKTSQAEPHEPRASPQSSNQTLSNGVLANTKASASPTLTLTQKRTKKVAKRKRSAHHTGAGLKKSPNVKGKANSSLAAKEKPIVQTKRRTSGESANADSKAIGNTKAILPKEKNGKKKGKRAKPLPAGGAPAKKRPKTQKPESIGNKKMPKAVGGAGKSPRKVRLPAGGTNPNKCAKDSFIEKVANAVADTVADEIHYCAPMFDAKRPIFASDGVVELKSGTVKPVKVGASPPKLDFFDASTVVMAVKRFVLEVYCPFLISAKKSSGIKTPNSERIAISTLLAIRDMLIMNAEHFFRFSALKRPSVHGAADDKVYLSHALANAIVRNVAKRLPKVQLAQFSRAVQNYDTKSDEFQFSLAYANAGSTLVRREGGIIGAEESLLAKVSFNYARERHPLLSTKSSTFKECIWRRRQLTSETTCLLPTACAVFQIEEAPKPDFVLTKDTAEILEELKLALRGERQRVGTLL